MRRIWCLALLLAACMPARESGVDVSGGASAPPELGSTLNVRVAADSVLFELHITNATSRAVTTEFATAQRYDFEVLTPTGERVWRWSDDQVFAQMLGAEELAPGETRVYRERWAPVAAAGEYIAIGRLTSSNLPVELRTPVDVPGQ